MATHLPSMRKHVCETNKKCKLDHITYISTQVCIPSRMLSSTNFCLFSFILLGLWNFIEKDELKIRRYLEEKILKIHIF